MSDPTIQICPNCGGALAVPPYRPGDQPGRQVHVDTGQEDC
jgi:hypothetical protein